MKKMTLSTFLFPTFLLAVAFPAFADVTVSSPGNGDEVTSPFELTASSPSCSSQTVSAMGYSLDNSANNTTVQATSVEASVTAATGAHTLHVKSWGTKGAACVTDVAITVIAGSSSSAVSSEGITVRSPGSGATVGSPFALSADAASCSGQTVAAMGYSLDSSAANTIVDNTSVAATVSAAAGAHTLHVKSWGNKGSTCVATVPITVGSAASAVTSSSGIDVSSPGNEAQVSSPFALEASASTCSSQPVTALGYSLDSSPDNTIVDGTSVNTQVTAASGAHTLHVKSWGKGNTSCVSNLAITVSAPANASAIPSDAVSVSSIQTLSNWEDEFDTGTGSGSSSGKMNIVSSPSYGGSARQFVTGYSNYGGERYHVQFGDDTTSTNFFYDTWVYLTSSISSVANIEMDMNQTMPNGQTAIFGFQCDGYSSTWDYTANKGAPTSPVDTWVHSNQACNIHNWGINTWHHVQVSYSRNSSGAVTYKSVWLDDKEQDINATVPSAFALGWGPSLVTNLQVDGLGAGGSATVYLDDLTVYRW